MKSYRLLQKICILIVSVVCVLLISSCASTRVDNGVIIQKQRSYNLLDTCQFPGERAASGTVQSDSESRTTHTLGSASAGQAPSAASRSVDAAYRQRRAKGAMHPVHDFLFIYYPFAPSLLERWQPAFGQSIEASAEDTF